MWALGIWSNYHRGGLVVYLKKFWTHSIGLTCVDMHAEKGKAKGTVTCLSKQIKSNKIFRNYNCHLIAEIIEWAHSNLYESITIAFELVKNTSALLNNTVGIQSKGEHLHFSFNSTVLAVITQISNGCYITPLDICASCCLSAALPQKVQSKIQKDHQYIFFLKSEGLHFAWVRLLSLSVRSCFYFGIHFCAGCMWLLFLKIRWIILWV